MGKVPLPSLDGYDNKRRPLPALSTSYTTHKSPLPDNVDKALWQEFQEYLEAAKENFPDVVELARDNIGRALSLYRQTRQRAKKHGYTSVIEWQLNYPEYRRKYKADHKRRQREKMRQHAAPKKRGVKPETKRGPYYNKNVAKWFRKRRPKGLQKLEWWDS